MAGQMTLFYIISWHNKEQAQCYQINVNLFHWALTERKPKGGSIHPPPLPLYHGGSVGVQVIRTIYIIMRMNGHDS